LFDVIDAGDDTAPHETVLFEGKLIMRASA
jgi:hypothetical protein